MRKYSLSKDVILVTFQVGRAHDADVIFDDIRVSRRQIEITVTADNRYYVVDCGSTAGTCVYSNDRWTPLTQGYVEEGEQIAFGDFSLPFSDIVSRLPAFADGGPSSGFEPLSVRPLRSADTGELVVRGRKS